jgi:hypothetical protein
VTFPRTHHATRLSGPASTCMPGTHYCQRKPLTVTGLITPDIPTLRGYLPRAAREPDPGLRRRPVREGTGARETGIGGLLFRKGSCVVTRSFRTRGHPCESGTQPVTPPQAPKPPLCLSRGYSQRSFDLEIRWRQNCRTRYYGLMDKEDAALVNALLEDPSWSQCA